MARAQHGECAARRNHPFDKHLNLSACFLHSQQSRLDDARIVEYEQIASSHEPRQIGKLKVFAHAGVAVEMQHPELGAVTLRQLLATWVAHDLGHIAQTSRVMAKQYRDAVGPWRAYLPVLDR